MNALSPDDRAILAEYESSKSYKTLAREHHRGEQYVRRLIMSHAPHLMRTRSEQAYLNLTNNPAMRPFRPEDLGLVFVGDCKVCGIPMVGLRKTERRQTCGLCEAYALGIAA